MKPVIKRCLTHMTLLASLLGGTGWSVNSYACSPEPYIAAVCLMAVAGSQTHGFDDMFVPANGQVLTITDNQAIYSLIGTTYGGKPSLNFNLPNLQGRVVVGAGQYTDTSGNATYKVGQYGGLLNNHVALNISNLPPHIHGLIQGGGMSVNVQTGTGTLAANVSLAPVTATTNLSGVTATADGTALTLYASSGGTLTTAPFGASLGTPGVSTKIYSSATPYVAMQAGSTGSIRGTAPVTFSGNPSTTLNGNPIATMTGSPAVAVSVSGATAPAGGNQGQPVPIVFNTMQPYLSMVYFIALKGYYPTPNN